MFNKAKWIWRKEEAKPDEHVDFIASFMGESSKKYTLTIAVDSNYALYINGTLAAFGQYADYPQYKVCDVVDITEFVRTGENHVAILVWYYGVKDTSTYTIGKAGLIYEITNNDGEVLLCSDENTLSRLSPAYIQHKCDLISGQLGLTFHRDEKMADNFINEVVPGFEESRVVDGISYKFNKRPNKKLVLEDRLPARICQQGTFNYTCDREVGPNLQHAALSFHFTISMDGKLGFNPILTDGGRSANLKAPDYADGGIYFIVDLGAETAGFIDFDIEVPEDCRIDIGWGEHLNDGRCRTAVVQFWFDYLAKKGRNTFMDPIRRMGCRYVEFFIHSREAVVHYAGLRPTTYPLNVKKYQSGNLLRDTIYEVCQNTLIQCLHEHYEDCPGREQALYTLDSRNQMLCGYYAFGETEAPRASLRLIANGLQPDGLLTLCYPSDMDLLIPCYSCAYIMQMDEYIQHSGDITLAEECYGVLETIMNTFESEITSDGLVVNPGGHDRYWNFYEWQPTLMGQCGEVHQRTTDAPLNAFYSLALENMKNICTALGKTDEAEKYAAIREKLNRAIAETFYNEETKLFETRLEADRGQYSVLTNSLCLLCGAAEGLDCENILKILATNGKDNLGLEVIPNTLSMNSFRFDALLRADFEKYKPIILDEIDRDYFAMLRRDATTFWETLNGDHDVIGIAGSLCHGWSALPIYYYEILNK